MLIDNGFIDSQIHGEVTFYSNLTDILLLYLNLHYTFFKVQSFMRSSIT